VKPAQDTSKQNTEAYDKTIELEKPESTKKSPGHPKKTASNEE
jgi:hypothetical protein